MGQKSSKSPPPPPVAPQDLREVPICMSTRGSCRGEKGAWNDGVSLEVCSTAPNELTFISSDSGWITNTTTKQNQNPLFVVGGGDSLDFRQGAYYKGNIVLATREEIDANQTRCEEYPPGHIWPTPKKPYTSCLDVDDNNRVVARKCRKWGIWDQTWDGKAIAPGGQRDENHEWILESV